jgi:DNA-binding transcriptional regulator YiaG
MRQHEWPPHHITFLRRQVLREDVDFFAAHWVKEDGSNVSGRSVEAWEQGRRKPSLFIRQHMSRVLYRLRNRQGRTIRMPSENT